MRSGDVYLDTDSYEQITIIEYLGSGDWLIRKTAPLKKPTFHTEETNIIRKKYKLSQKA